MAVAVVASGVALMCGTAGEARLTRRAMPESFGMPTESVPDGPVRWNSPVKD